MYVDLQYKELSKYKIKVMCKVSWCNKEDRFFKNGKPKALCSIHIQYEDWVTNARTRPWLMYKLEKILSDDLCCEGCGIDKQKQHPTRPLRQIISLFDVDHINPPLKGTLEGEQPSNYQLLCNDCHKFKSHDEGDFIANKK